jgi:type IV pilus assembly protein PilN
MDELASLVPSGVILKSIKQADTIIISGYAQSNARVSELLRNLGTQAHWLTQPELVEIKSASYGQGKDARKIFEFNLSVSLARTPLERQ